MAKQTSTPKSYDFEEYQYAALAARLNASEESSKYAPSALEVLAGEKGLNLGEKALGFIKGTQVSKEGIKTAIDVYNSLFEEKKGQYKPADFVKWYGSVLSSAEKEDSDKITKYLGKYTETLKSISEAVNDALNTLDEKAKKGKFTEAQKSDAKKTLEKYQTLLSILHTLDEYKFDELRADAVSETRKKDLKTLASKL